MSATVTASALTRTANVLAFVVTLMAVAVCAPTASRAAWPDRTVTIVVPYAAAGNTDIMARLAAQALQKKYGQTFIVENLPGAGGALGTQRVVRAAPDGYTLLFASTAQISVLPYTQKIKYDPLTDLIPVGVFGQAISILAVSKSLPVKDLAGLIAYAKANPGKLNYASGGLGTISHLAATLLAERAGLQMVHVPYGGGAPAINDLLAGRVDLYFGNSADLQPYSKSPDIRIIAVGSEKRVDALPEVPTVADTIPGFVSTAWNGFLAPKGTPPAVIESLSMRLSEITRDHAIIKRLHELAIEPGRGTSTDMAETIKNEQATYKAAVKAAGIAR